MKILIVNIHSVRNAGDHALLQAAIQQLRRRFPNSTITLSMNDQEGYRGSAEAVDSFLHWFRRQDVHGSPLRSWRWFAIPVLLIRLLVTAILYRQRGYRSMFAPRYEQQRGEKQGAEQQSNEQQALLRAYVDADLVVSCPGGYLYSTGKLGLWFLVTLLTLAFPIWLGKPVYLLPQTIGPLQHPWERWLLRRILPKVRQIYVRDEYSRNLLETIGVHQPQIYVTPDLAFGYQEEERVTGAELLRNIGVDPEHDRPLLGVTLLNWAGMESSFHGQEAYEAAVATAIHTFLAQHGGKAVLFAQVRGPALAEDDRLPARRVQQQLRELGTNVVVVEEDVTTAQLKAAYSYMTLFMGSRLHSNIFALTSGIPVIAIAYLPKTRGVMRMLGLERWVVNIEHVEGAPLYELLNELYSDREMVRAQIQTAIATQQSTITAMSRSLYEDYLQWQNQG